MVAFSFVPLDFDCAEDCSIMDKDSVMDYGFLRDEQKKRQTAEELKCLGMTWNEVVELAMDRYETQWRSCVV